MPIPLKCALMFFTGDTAAGCEVFKFPSSIAVVKNEWTFTSTPPYMYLYIACMYVGFETLFYVVRHLDSTASYLPTCLRLRKAKYASEREKKKERKKLIIENFVI